MENLCFEYFMVLDQIERLQQTLSMVRGDFELWIEESLDLATDDLRRIGEELDEEAEFQSTEWGI